MTHFAAAIYCICHICKINCRSCNLSNSYPLKSSQLKNTALQANKVNDENVESRHYFLNQGSVCVITANELLIKTVCFAVVTNEEQTSHAEGKDGCGISIQPGESNFKGKCSSKSEVIVFHPHVTHFAAAIYCICHICKINCRSCNLSNSYPLKSSQLKNTALQANKVNDENVESRHYFLNQGSVCVITANELLIKTVCFAVVTNEEQTSHAEGKDGCGISIQPGESNFKGKC